MLMVLYFLIQQVEHQVVVNMYYNGAAAGSRFVISRAATGGAEIELQSNGDVNINRLGNGNFLVGGEVTLDDYRWQEL